MPLYHRSGSPYWHVRIGRKTRRSTGTADREKAEEFERVLADRLWRQRRLGDRSAVSWREASERWLKDSPKARRRDREVLCWLSKQLEIDEYPVSAVADPDALEQLRQHGLADGWGHATVDRMMGTVSAVLRGCVRWRYLEYAPPVPMFRPRPGEPRWLTRDKFQRLCEELPKHLELAARFAVFSMLRMRAMLRLTWDRVDLAEQPPEGRATVWLSAVRRADTHPPRTTQAEPERLVRLSVQRQAHRRLQHDSLSGSRQARRGRPTALARPAPHGRFVGRAEWRYVAGIDGAR